MTGHYKVRIVIGGVLLHLASVDEPKVQMYAGQISSVTAQWIDDVGDTVGFINWPDVIAITWRWHDTDTGRLK